MCYMKHPTFVIKEHILQALYDYLQLLFNQLSHASHELVTSNNTKAKHLTFR